MEAILTSSAHRPLYINGHRSLVSRQFLRDSWTFQIIQQDLNISLQMKGLILNKNQNNKIAQWVIGFKDINREAAHWQLRKVIPKELTKATSSILSITTRGRETKFTATTYQHFQARAPISTTSTWCFQHANCRRVTHPAAHRAQMRSIAPPLPISSFTTRR